MAIGKTTRAYESTSQNLKGLLEGVILAIDPSVGSNSSMPGWAVYRAGQLVSSGILEIPPHETIWSRLCRLSNGIRKLYEKYSPDVLVYEEIPAQRHGFGNAEAHASLLKAVGAILSVPGPEGYVGIYPTSWKKQARTSYVKSDEADAIELGWVILELARSISNTATTRKKRK